MGHFHSLKDAQSFFEGDRFARVNGMSIDSLSDDSCTCSVTLTDDHRNAVGGVMGGVIFTLADFAFAVASNHRSPITVAQQVSINFLSSSKGSRLFATAHCKRDGHTTCVYNIDVTDDLGAEIAQFIGTGYKIPNKE